MVPKKITMTPAWASDLLLLNNRNRPLTQSLVNRYASIMKRGEWLLSPQPIVIGDDNVLMDGQHRLAAIVKSGVSIEILLVEKMASTQGDLRTADIIDTGKPRKTGDQLAIEHELPNGRRIAGCVTVLSYICVGITHKLDVKVALDIYHMFKSDTDEILELAQDTWFEKKSKVLAALIFCQNFDRKLYDFSHGVITGINLVDGSPALVCRNYLMRVEKWEYPLVHKITHSARSFMRNSTLKRISYVNDKGTKWFRDRQKEKVQVISSFFQ